MSNSAVVHFELDCSLFDRAVYSDKVSAGGHDWQMYCTPKDVEGFVTVCLELISQAWNVEVIFDAAITCSDQVVGPSCFSRRRTVLVYSSWRRGEYVGMGFARFIHRDDLHDYAGSNGRVTVMCALSVLDHGRTPTSIAKAPPLPEKKGIAATLLSEIGDHLGCLLDSGALSDVSFVVGEAPPLHAHRAILAACSPVFKAQFCGHMLEGNTDTPSLTITVPDMDPETFKAMLRFMYTDNLPAGLGLGHDDEGKDEALRSLLAAADRYALDRLKLLCARKLLGNMSVDTVVTLLDCAETYNCPELKTKCIEFVVADENFDKVALTDAFIHLVVTRSPSLLADMRNIAWEST